jgi:hypothetical protein
MSVAYPFIEPRTHATDVIATSGISTDRTVVTLVNNYTANDFKNGTMEITDAAGAKHMYTIVRHGINDFWLYEPLDLSVAVADNVELSDEMGIAFVDAHETFWCTNVGGSGRAPKVVYYDPRILIDATGANPPGITDADADETIASTSDIIRVVRNTTLTLELDSATTNGVIFKAGSALDETNYAIDNSNLIAEEQESLSSAGDVTSITLNCKHYNSVVSNTATGRVRMVIDIADKTTYQGSTTLTANAYIGDTTLTVTSTAGIGAGHILLLIDGTVKELVQVVSVAGGVTINLEAPLRKAFTSATGTVKRAYYNKVVLDVMNPYGPFNKDTPLYASIPQRIGAVYRVTYEKAAGKVLARAVLDDADISRPVTMKRDEQLKSGIEIVFDWDD